MYVLVAFALVLAFQFMATLPALQAPGMSMDEGMLLYYPELLTKGLLPQRDFESMYPPGNIWLLSAAYSVFGTTVQVERTCGLLYQIALVAAFFVLLSRWSLPIAVAGCALCIIALLPLHLVAFAWVGGSALALWAIVAIAGRGRTEWRGALAGGLAGLAMTYRADLAPALILALSAYCILARWNRRAVLWLLGSASVALLPMLAHALVVSPAVFFDNIFTKPVLTCSPARVLPLDFSRSFIGQLYSLLLISTGLAILAGWRVYRTMSTRDPALLAAGLLSLGALPQALTRSDFVHLSFVTPLAFPLLAIAASVLISRHKLTPALTVASVLVLLPQTAKVLRDRLLGTGFPTGSVFVVRSGERTFPVSGLQYAIASQDVISRLTELSRPGETLFVGPDDLRYAFANDVFLYHMFPWLSPRSYYLEMNPLSANRTGSGLAEQVAGSDWLVLSSLWNQSNEPNQSQISGPTAPNEVVSSGFDLVFSKPPFRIFKRHASTAPTPSPAESGQTNGMAHQVK